VSKYDVSVVPAQPGYAVLFLFKPDYREPVIAWLIDGFGNVAPMTAAGKHPQYSDNDDEALLYPDGMVRYGCEYYPNEPAWRGRARYLMMKKAA